MARVRNRSPRSTAHDSLVVAGAQVLKVLAYGAGIVVLSRLLDQSEFGLLTMVTALVGIGELFRDFGLSLATIQAPTVSNDQRSNLFWTNVAIGAVLSALAVALSGPIAAFYGQSELRALVLVVAWVFVSNGVAAQYRAGLVRQRRFIALAVTDVAGICAAFAIAVVLAVSGAGAVSLAVQVLAQSVVATVLAVVLSGWLPGLPNSRGRIRPFVDFSVNLLGVQVLTYAGRNIDNVVIGRTFGPVALGFYSKAYQLYSQPQNQGISSLTDLAVNALARISDDPGAYLRLLIRIQTATSYAALGGFAILIAAAHPVVRVLLGPGWSETADLLRILSIGGTFQILGNVYFWLFLSRGLSRVQLISVLVTQPVAVLAVFVGAIWGTTGVAWAVSAGMILEWFIPATWGAAKAGVAPWILLRNTIRPLILAAVIFSAVQVVVLSTPSLGAVIQLLLAVLTAALCALLVCGASRSIREELLDLTRRFFSRGARRAVA